MHTHHRQRNPDCHQRKSPRGTSSSGRWDQRQPVQMVNLGNWARHLQDWGRDMPGRHRTLRYPQSVAGKKQAAWEAHGQQRMDGNTVP
jgi:hypothetical protein